jgi:hypothetical protein
MTTKPKDTQAAIDAVHNRKLAEITRKVKMGAVSVMCSAPSCGAKPVAHGLCQKHYMRLRRSGDASKVMRPWESQVIKLIQVWKMQPLASQFTRPDGTIDAARFWSAARREYMRTVTEKREWPRGTPLSLRQIAKLLGVSPATIRRDRAP